MKTDSIKHDGRVISVTPGKIIVEITSNSACAVCHARAMCPTSESATKRIDIVNIYGGKYSEGDKVRVVLKRSLGLKAVFISYVVPLIVLMILLLTLPRFYSDERVSGLITLGAVALYYFCLYLFRKRISDNFDFFIEDKTDND
ncbi:MAG: SoxR reducing system RseC family protein [Bacteroidales bacterium]|jgi:sigma-E factor negative regulatory protein RseC|nr:SoxR reducing system RseC family protein [Bacteroidales bacterium]